MATDAFCKSYPEVRFGGFSRYDGTLQFYSRVRSLIQTSDTVLDVGCGRGCRQEDQSSYRRELQSFRSIAKRVIGIDVDAAGSQNPLLDEFRQIDDVEKWPIETESVDVALTDYVLEHVANPSSFFSEARRVLKPGGYLCARTPNRFGYVAILSSLIPNRLHSRVVSYVQKGRKHEDVFATFYRCNSRRSLRAAFQNGGFETVVYSIEGEPTYFSFSPLLYRLAACAHRLLPPQLQSTLLAFGQKKPDPQTA